MITYETNRTITPEEALSIYERSGLTRPKDLRVVQNMLTNASVIVTAWENETCIGLLRAMTDYSFDCYINDVAVDQSYQQRGIGKELIHRLRQLLDNKTLVFLIASRNAVPFYTKLGFTNDLKQVGEPFCLVHMSE